MFAFIVTAILSFISTEIDNILVMVILFANGDKVKKSHVIIGQYLSLGILTAISIMGAFGLTFLPQRYVGLLGLIPIFLGIREYLNYKKERLTPAFRENGKITKQGILSVTLIALVNGADNIGIYIPIFASYTAGQLVGVIAIFTVMMALWCLLAELVTKSPRIKTPLQKYRHIIVPIVFIVLGAFVIISNIPQFRG